MMRATITERRAALAAEQDRAELEYARAEEQIKAMQQALFARQRDLDVRSGAIRQLDALLALPALAEAMPAAAIETSRAVSLRERLIGFVRVPIWRGW